MSKKQFKTWEIEKGLFAVDESAYDSTQMLSEEEFMQLWVDGEGQFVGVSYEDRIQFLNDNDYEVTRENIVNADLSVKPRE
jgi:hypothetical protein